MGETETSDVRSSPSRGGAAGGGVSGGTEKTPLGYAVSPLLGGNPDTSTTHSSPDRGGAAGGGVSGSLSRGGAEVTVISKYSRHIAIGANSTFTGTGIMMDRIDIEIITEVM
jgi:hypothetical protein